MELSVTNRKVGRPRIFDKRVTLSFDLDKSLYDLLNAEAEAKGTSKSSILRQAIKEYLTMEDLG